MNPEELASLTLEHLRAIRTGAAPVAQQQMSLDDLADEITTELLDKIGRLSRKNGHDETEVGLVATVNALLQLFWRVPYPQWRGELAEEAIQRLQVLQTYMPSRDPRVVWNRSTLIN